MRIAAVVVTCNRIDLLSRALNSIEKQYRKPDFVFVVSNSSEGNFKFEDNICKDFGYSLTRNKRTNTYTGALNTSVEEIIKHFGISDDVYFASLDDDDEWLPNYLQEIEINNTDDFDLLIGNLLRKSSNENELQVLPTEISTRDFLIGNPGVSGSNTFIRLSTLLQAGSFDEGITATVDRDFFVRVFQQEPKYKIVNKHLVTQYTDCDRPRQTTNAEIKKQSLLVFYYKYQHLMNYNDKESFFTRAEKLFSVSRTEFKNLKSNLSNSIKKEIQFENKGNYQFIIGFIAGDAIISSRILKQIIEKKIPVELVLIIDNTPNRNLLLKCEELLKAKNFSVSVVEHQEWLLNLEKGNYGSAFKKFSMIDSIPLGRTILHHHLYTETIKMQNPVFWIIDDDISFSSTILETESQQTINLFEIVNQYEGKVDSIIGGVSCDPPLPTLSCIRGQLVDFWHSHKANNSLSSDFLQLKLKPDYYYDLSDIHSDHLESPIYHSKTNENGLKQIFSGKSLSRPALQKDLKVEEKTISKRGPNTLVFNRELLHSYPVINLQVNNKFARRGDLLWALLNQVVSEKKILEHSFSVDQNRPVSEFVLKKELQKAAYDIIGYAFNKGILQVINQIKEHNIQIRPVDIFDKLNQENYYQDFLKIYIFFLQKRKIRFLMNYHRIIGLTKLLSKDFESAKIFYKQVSDLNALSDFENLFNEAKEEYTLKSFFKEFNSTIMTYNSSIANFSTDKNKQKNRVPI